MYIQLPKPGLIRSYVIEPDGVQGLSVYMKWQMLRFLLHIYVRSIIIL
jgi:hypothetical protein